MEVTTDCRDACNMVRFLVVDICQCASSQSSPHPSRNQELAWQCLCLRSTPHANTLRDQRYLKERGRFSVLTEVVFTRRLTCEPQPFIYIGPNIDVVLISE